MNLCNCFAICVLIITVSANSDERDEKYFAVEALDPLQALKFEEVGSLKLIVETKTLTFNFNLSNLVETTDKGFKEKLALIKSLCDDQNGGSCGKSISIIIEQLEAKKDELEDMVKKPKLSREKRDIFGLMTQYDGQKIHGDLKNMQKTLIKIHDLVNEHQAKLESIMLQLNQTAKWLDNSTAFNHNQSFRIEASMLIYESQHELSELSEKLSSIYRVMLSKRMDVGLISNSEFQKKLDGIESKLTGTSKTLPFRNVRDYLNNVEALHSIHNNTLTIEMRIPIIEERIWSLFKIHKLPAQNDDKLVILDTQWSYLANDSSHILNFISLDYCLNDDQKSSTYLCEVQSPLVTIDSDGDCITKAFKDRQIDMKVCAPMIRSVQYLQLTFVRYSDGQYFYFTNQDESLQIICHGVEEIVILKSKTGMIYLQPGCSVITERVKIFVTGRSYEAPHWNQNVLVIKFELETFKNSIENLKTPPVLFTHIHENVQHLLTAMSFHKNPKDIKHYNLNYLASFLSFEEAFFVAVTILLLLTLIFLCFCCRRGCRKSKNYESMTKIKT